MKRLTLGLAALGLLALGGCPAVADDLCAKGTCDPPVADGSGTSPPDGGHDGAQAAPRDPCVETPDASECLDEASALFVSAAADPSVANGTAAKPFASLRTAIENVTDARRRIYVCSGTYAEQVAVSAPLTIIGGLSCDFRTRTTDKPKIAPPSGIAFAVAKVSGVSVLDVVVEAAADATAKGSSAIAVFVTRADDVLLRRVDAIAGNATDGETGAAAGPNFDAPPKSGIGTDTFTGADAPVCDVCKDGTTRSIAGGGAGGGKASQKGDAIPPVGVDNSKQCPGGGGANGQPPPAAKGAERPGILRETSWDTSTTAESGGVGHPGQGGGGSTSDGVMGGGSGGCGGCGGAGGGAGGNGGSSIALLVYESAVVVDGGTFTAGAAGAGGAGGDGTSGQNGAAGGSGYCFGGGGGKGTGGGGGGGGAGGHSAAIAFIGTAPVTTATNLVFAAGGAAGEGGAGGGGGVPGPKGLAGGAGNGVGAGVATLVMDP